MQTNPQQASASIQYGVVLPHLTCETRETGTCSSSSIGIPHSSLNRTLICIDRFAQIKLAVHCKSLSVTFCQFQSASVNLTQSSRLKKNYCATPKGHHRSDTTLPEALPRDLPNFASQLKGHQRVPKLYGYQKTELFECAFGPLSSLFPSCSPPSSPFRPPLSYSFAPLHLPL